MKWSKHLEQISEKVTRTLLVLVVKSNKDCSSDNVFSDVTKSVNPAALNICVNKTRKIKNGVAIHCKDDKSLKALKTSLSSSLGQEYSFDKQQKLNPRMMLYDVRLEVLNSPNEIVESIISLNELEEEHKADIRYITKLKRSNTTDIVLEVSPQLRKCFLRRRFLFIGWKASNVSDYVRVKNGYKCCGYGHFSKDCKSELHCPKCAGSHKLKDCKAETEQCINCLKYNRQHNRNIPTDHEATFSACSVHKTYVENHKVDDLIKGVYELFSEARTKLISQVEENAEQAVRQTSPSYASIVKKDVSVIIKPKNINQSHSETRNIVRQNVNPVDNDIKFSQVKNVKNGGLVIRCDGPDDASKLKELASQSLSEEYEIKEVRKQSPRVRIVGMTENIACDRMVAMLKSQNRIFGNSSDCKVLKVWPTKKRGEIYQALLEVDSATYSGLLGQGSVLLVNVDNCVVYDALGLKICFKCCGLNHYAKDCKKSEQICIKSAGNHKVSECNSAQLKCVNCVSARNAQVDHAVWDSDKCCYYRSKLDEYKKQLLGIE
nr:unnamed protein product [Callosobruchus analis]